MKNEYIELIYERYSKLLYKLSIIMLHNEQDAIMDALLNLKQKYRKLSTRIGSADRA